MDDELKRIARGGLRRGRDLARRIYRDSPLYARADDVRLLVETELFDHEWYSAQVGETLDRKRAARHYLEQDPNQRSAQPSPLFDPEFFVHRLSPRDRRRMGDQDPFLFFLRERMWLLPTHPLFDTLGYTERRKTGDFYGGAIGQYVNRGARNGRRANDWLQPGEDGRFPDLRTWIADRHEEWRARQSPTPTWRSSLDGSLAVPAVEDASGRQPEGSVSVVVDLGADDESALETLRSVQAQSGVKTQVIVIDRGLTPRAVEAATGATVVAGDPDRGEPGVCAAFARLDGDYAAYVPGGDVWGPGRLARLALVAETRGLPLVADVLERPWTEERYAVDVPGVDPGPEVPGELFRVLLSRLLVAVPYLREVGGPRDDVGVGWAYDLALRLSRGAGVPVCGEVGVTRAKDVDPRRPSRDRLALDPFELESQEDVVRNRTFVDWAELATREPDPDVVSLIIPTFDDSVLTLDAVQAVIEAGAGDKRLDVIVWDNGSSATVSAVLDSLPLQYPEAKVVHSPVNHNFALGNNLAMPYVTGQTVIFLNNDTTALDGWLEPLVAGLEDPDVLAAQPVLLYPSGSVQSAGVVFPPFGGLPYNLLAEYPREDAEGIADHRFSALTGAAMAMRYHDVVAMRGFDPIFTNGMEDVDLCHRLARHRAGYFKVVPESRVVHHESKSKGRFARAPRNRLIYLDRWRGVLEPRDDVAAWSACGYEVVGRKSPEELTFQRQKLHAATRPVVARKRRATVTEGDPQLRWAIKISAPAEPVGESWGDTHFARSLARSLRKLGQDVVIDHHYEWDRPSAEDDDVTLTLRGLSRYLPAPDNRVNIGWVISHPAEVERFEVAAFDRLLAASVPWAERMSAHWGTRIDPLLQATDPDRFNPDRAVPDTGHPVLFVGTSRDVERPIVRDSIAAGLPLSIYGHGWEAYIPRHYIKAQRLANADLGSAYRSAGVVLNDHWDDMRADGFLSNRLFDAVASGARVITDDVIGLRDVFGDSVQTYETVEDLIKLSSLPDPSVVFGTDEFVRSEAARIHREHGFDARARALLDIALEERAKRSLSS